ncbi:hypothetical protein GF382_03885 [Candidatus Falkowbacteria bacterium]|nr:hypothetical protein [Candidatus Falkowbacteria bacterium]
MCRFFQISFIALFCLALSNCSSLRLVDLDHARDVSEIARGEEPGDGRCYGRSMTLAKKVVRERTPDVDEQGRYLVLLRNESHRSVKIKLYKSTFCQNVFWFEAALGKDQDHEVRLPPGKYLAQTWFQGRCLAQREYEITTARSYDSYTDKTYAKIIRYLL